MSQRSGKTPTNHDSDEYVLKDCEYTYKLWDFFTKQDKFEGTNALTFYQNKLLPWTKLLARQERHGAHLNMAGLEQLEPHATGMAKKARRELDKLWRGAYKRYHGLKVGELQEEIKEKAHTALTKLAASAAKNATMGGPKAVAKAVASYENRLAGDRERYRTRKDALPTKLNFNSDPQMHWLFKEYFECDITKYDGTEGTNVEVLERLRGQGVPGVAQYLEYRHWDKIATSFCSSYKRHQYEGRIHCSFNPGIARTGRLTSSDPNLQQVPSYIREQLFTAPPGKVYGVFDAGQIEARLIAYFYALASDDPTYYNAAITLGDFHSNNVRVMFGLDIDDLKAIKAHYPAERDFCKMVGFALLYGARHRRIHAASTAAGFGWTLAECKQKYEAFKEEYAGVFEFKAALDDRLRNDATIKNVLGRRFNYIGRHDDITMKGFNRLVQGSASDLIQDVATRTQAFIDGRGWTDQVVLQVHDETVIEADPDHTEEIEAEIHRIMREDIILDTKFGRVPLIMEGGWHSCWQK